MILKDPIVRLTMTEIKEVLRGLSDPVILDVGGVRYSTTYSTLTLYPDSMLGRLFGGELPLKKNEDGAVFIDRDGALFRHILNFLRCGRLSLPRPFPEIEALKLEADFFQISPLIQALTDYQLKDPVRLNVGGTQFSASREILTKHSDSYLSCLVEGVIEVDMDDEGRIFIDQDGVLFRHVINFLRTDRLTVPDDFRDFNLLEEEAVFYQIPPFTEALKRLRCSHRIVEIVERSDCYYLMVHGPDVILNHPNLPITPTRTNPEENFLSVSDADRDRGIYFDRGYCLFAGAYKTDLRRFLQKIGCRYLDTSMAMVLLSDTTSPRTVTKEAERWSVPWATE